MGEIVRMPYEDTLYKYCESYHNNDEFSRLFYVMDYTMKNIHNKGYYITNFNPKNIVVGVTNKNQDYVIFNSLDVMDNDITNKINNNIYNLAFLQVGLLSGTLDYLRPDFLKENFSQFKIFIPENLVNYYQRVLVNRGYFYLTDYLNTKNSQEINKLSKSLEEDGGRGRSYVKSTGHYDDDDKIIPMKLPNEDNKDNIAAFVTNYALAFVIIASSLLIPIIAFLLGSK